MKKLPCQHSHHHTGVIATWSDFCAVAPSPQLKERMTEELEKIRGGPEENIAMNFALARTPRPLGFDDGVIIPPEEFPLGVSATTIRNAAAQRAPLRGTVRVIVVLVDFSDKKMTASTQHFQDLFFSVGVLPHGSVKEYYREATGKLVDITGEVVGPFRLPQTLAWYANNNFGIGRPSGTPRANIMAKDAAVAANPSVNFGIYDNDGNGYVDAFIVIHAGLGGEETGNSGDIWSHKWTLPSAYSADGTKIYAYLTVPENARIGVCAHELGHLLFGFPDLYDTDNTSEGIGNWCLMAGGSWNGGGDIPAHPSAWCKANQGWVSVSNVTTSSALSIADVKTSHNVYRLWKDGAGGSEYFLLENRQRTGYDAQLPGDGLLIWHIDENQPGNTDENHYKVGLVQADGKRDMDLDRNRGDAGDPYPGTSSNHALTVSTVPASKSYAGQDTCVSIKNISASGSIMTASVSISCIAQSPLKANKKSVKEAKDFKASRKEVIKEYMEFKSILDGKSLQKDAKDFVEGGKGPKEHVERPGGELGFGGVHGSEAYASGASEMEARVAALERALGIHENAESFIPAELRPDLAGGAVYDEADGAIAQRMASGDATAKRTFDNMPPPVPGK